MSLLNVPTYSTPNSLSAVPNSLFAGLGRLENSGDPELVTLRQPLALELELHAVNLLVLQLLDQVVEFLFLLRLGFPLVLVLEFRKIPTQPQRQRDKAVDYRYELGRGERVPGYAVLERDLLPRVRFLLALLLRGGQWCERNDKERQRKREGPSRL